MNAAADGFDCPPDAIHSTRDRIHCPLAEIHAMRDGLHCPPGEIHSTPGRIKATPDHMNAIYRGNDPPCLDAPGEGGWSPQDEIGHVETRSAKPRPTRAAPSNSGISPWTASGEAAYLVHACPNRQDQACTEAMRNALLLTFPNWQRPLRLLPTGNTRSHRPNLAGLVQFLLGNKFTSTSALAIRFVTCVRSITWRRPMNATTPTLPLDARAGGIDV